MRKKLIVPMIVLSIGAIGFFVWAQNNSSENPPSAENYTPNFWFDSDEKYFPADPLDFYFVSKTDKTNLLYYEEITGERAVAKYNALSLNEKLSKIKVFYTIKDQDREWVYEYWVFYVLNDFENGHYGDWESVFVVVDKNSGKIVRVNGSAHGSSNELNNLGNQKHVWVYVGNGSHANCPDKTNDGRCDFWTWNSREGDYWNQDDIHYGSKILNMSYVLKNIDDSFVSNFQKKTSFSKEKSPILGINLYKTFRLQDFNIPKPKNNTFVNFPIIGEMFGRTPEFAWKQPQYDNPELIRPLGNVAVEKTQKFVQNVSDGIRDNVNLAVSEFQYILNEINPFEASVSQILETKDAQETEAINEVEAAEEIGDNEEESLLALQEKLDDAAETIDVLDQKTTDLLAKKNEKKNANVLRENEKVPEEILKQESRDEDSEEIQSEKDEPEEEEIEEQESQDVDNESENIGKTALETSGKTCEKGVDNQLANRRIVINEVAWMGNEESANNEWIELKNISLEPINLSGWQILDKENQIKITFDSKAIIPALGFFLLERTNDSTLTEIKADKIYQGGLNNIDEALFIFDNNCQLIDEISAGPDWPAGDNESKRTMERTSDFNWQTSQNIGGTPKRENSVGFSETQDDRVGGLGGNPTVSPTILITEIQTTDATSSENDFIELYNPNSDAVDISSWQLKKKNSNGNEYSIRVFPENSIIQAQSYFIWMNTNYANQSTISADATSSQTIASNNSVALLDSDRNIIDQVGWGTSTDPFLETVAFSENPANGQTIARKWSTTTENYTDTDNNQSDFELQSPTPKAQNQSTESSEESDFETPTMSVVINEIMWMGTNSQNSADEWLELYNNTGSAVDLTGWKILKNGTDFINLATTTIAANSFYLLERTDSGATNVSENQVYTGALSNSGEKLELRNAISTLIDVVDASSGWFAGTTSPALGAGISSSAYISMERINSNASGSDFANWHNNNLATRNGRAVNNSYINGTPASQNSISKTETTIESLPFDEFDEITLTKLGNPYTIQNTLQVPQNKKLIIEPEVTLKFYIPNGYGSGDGAYLKVDGTLEAIGEANKEILFTSTGAVWPGIVFETDTVETEISSRLEYVRIEKARSWESNAYSAVKVIKKAVLIKNSTFENYYDLRGLYLLNSSSTIDNVVFNNFNASSSNSNTGEYPSGIFVDRGNPIIKNNTFANNYYGVTLGTTETCGQNSNFKISGNTFNSVVKPVYIDDTGFPCFEQNQVVDLQRDNSGNLFNCVIYQGANMEQDNLWSSDLAIIIEQAFSVRNATLTVAANTTAKFKSGVQAHLKIENNGRLITQGSAGNLVTFTSNAETPTAGNWKAIWFTSDSFGELNFTKIIYGGYGSGSFRNECLVNESANVVLNNLEKEFCEPYQ